MGGQRGRTRCSYLLPTTLGCLVRHLWSLLDLCARGDPASISVQQRSVSDVTPECIHWTLSTHLCDDTRCPTAPGSASSGAEAVIAVFWADTERSGPFFALSQGLQGGTTGFFRTGRIRRRGLCRHGPNIASIFTPPTVSGGRRTSERACSFSLAVPHYVAGDGVAAEGAVCGAFLPVPSIVDLPVPC